MSNHFYFLSFADKRWDSRRIKNEAIQSKWFDFVIVENEDSFEKWYVDKYKDRFLDRGFGYWQWKSYRIRRLLERMNEGDILLYLDAGCHINYVDGVSLKNKLLRYLSGKPIAMFQSNAPENVWTKADIYSFFDELNYPTVIKGQLQGGILLLKKTIESCSMIDEWFYICHNHYELINDAPSIRPNIPVFKENRHDQSIISLLANKYPVAIHPIAEIYTDGDWSTMSDKPIWAARWNTPKVSVMVVVKRKIKSLLKSLFSK